MLDSAIGGNSSVTLTWRPPVNGGSPITGYTLYRGTTSGAETPLTTVGNVKPTPTRPPSTATTYFYGSPR